MPSLAASGPTKLARHHEVKQQVDKDRKTHARRPGRVKTLAKDHQGPKPQAGLGAWMN
jgi:hypothetical protein